MSMSTNAEPLPCPFCGGNLIGNGRPRGKLKETHYAAHCLNCGANGPPADRASHAMMLWNTRTPAPAEEPAS